MFSSTGTMQPSQFYIDTVIKTKLKPNGKIIFNYLDSTYSDSLHLRSFFASKYDSILRDSVEYFILVNLTKKAISFRQFYGKNIVGAESAIHEKYGYKPISFFIYPTCGNSYGPLLILKPTEVLIISNFVLRSKGARPALPNCFARLQTVSNGVIGSTPYRKQIAKTSFYINSVSEKDYFFLEKQFAFQEKHD